MGGFIIYQQFQKRLKEINKQIKDTQKQIKKLPAGKLICCNDSWYQSDGHKKTYIKKKDKAFAEKLAIKKYLLALLKDLEQEKSAIDMYLRHRKAEHQNVEILFNSSTELSKLLSPYFSPPSKELIEWIESPYEKNSKHPEHLTHRIGPDEYVRSKSEAMIAKTLKQNKIPFRYECKLTLGDVELFPDFTMLHPRTKQAIFWEHFGLLDKPDYVKNMHSKLQLFTSYNIIPGINLIMTFETNDHPLSFEKIEKTIELYLS